MKKVKLINGVYGRRVSESVVERMTVYDPAFDVSDEEAERLVGLNVARYAESEDCSEEHSSDSVAIPVTDTTPVPDEPSQPETASTYNDSMKFDELKKIAREHGISKAKLHKMRSKREVIAAIDGAVEKASSRKEEAPQIGAANFI